MGLVRSPTANGACGVCDACNWFLQGNHPDFRQVEPQEEEVDDSGKVTKKASKQISVESVRGITDFLGLTAHRGGWRAAVVHPAEYMNAAAANALLKTLEEPPAPRAPHPGIAPARPSAAHRDLPLPPGGGEPAPPGGGPGMVATGRGGVAGGCVGGGGRRAPDRPVLRGSGTAIAPGSLSRRTRPPGPHGPLRPGPVAKGFPGRKLGMAGPLDPRPRRAAVCRRQPLFSRSVFRDRSGRPAGGPGRPAGFSAGIERGRPLVAPPVERPVVARILAHPLRPGNPRQP
ncbi:MAG: hypothetical protein IPG34_18075 [Rhodocyclaceae bacterium]|nr:hypothetical protein [Rhodocyclaceae bacterium]